MTSCSSRAIRLRSSATACCARCSRARRRASAFCARLRTRAPTSHAMNHGDIQTRPASLVVTVSFIGSKPTQQAPRTAPIGSAHHVGYRRSQRLTE